MSPSGTELLHHVLDECKYLMEEHRLNTCEGIKNSKRLSNAVCRSMEIIGEAAARDPIELRTAYPLVPWREMSDMRNKIIHDYFGVDYDIIWNTMEVDIPEVREWMELILKANPNQ